MQLMVIFSFVEREPGESSRRGFYIYDDRRNASPDPDLRKYIEKSRTMTGVVQNPKVILYLPVFVSS
jgi:enoyl-CoA hydratase/3-hydroxyacyl-CoA dehydrogenase